MFGIIRLALLGLIGLTVLYLVVRTYARSVLRERLEKEWDANPPPGKGASERQVYIDSGLQAYEHGLRRKLIWLVVILPIIGFAGIVYLVNYQ